MTIDLPMRADPFSAAMIHFLPRFHSQSFVSSVAAFRCRAIVDSFTLLTRFAASPELYSTQPLPAKDCNGKHRETSKPVARPILFCQRFIASAHSS
jgi:hypothetical protein